MKHLIKYLALPSCLLILTGSAHAVLSKSSGFYIDPGVGIGMSDSNTSFTGKKLSNLFAGGVNVGYQFMYQGAIEVGAHYFPNEKLSNNKKTSQNFDLDVALKLIKSITSINPNFNGLTFFVKGGYGRVFQTIKNSSNNGKHEYNTWFTGAGMSFFVDDNLGFTLQALISMKQKLIPTRYLASAGFTYIF